MNKKPIIIDSDFHALADDHEAVAMVGIKHLQGDLLVLGLTTVTGNTWAQVGAGHAREALTKLRLEGVRVLEGTGRPLLHRQSDFSHRSRLYGAAFGGAWGNAGLLDERSPPAPAARNGGDHAVGFLVDTIRQSETPVTVLAIGPLTNMALALRLAPDVCSNIERIVCMGGAFYVPGNVTPSAEFNWWFDPEAAAIVLEEDIDLLIVPLDATDAIAFDRKRYLHWSSRFRDHPMFRRFHRPKFEPVFARDSEFVLPVWDAVAAACLIEDGIVRADRRLWVSVDCSVGPSYGRVVAYPDAGQFNLPRPARRPARVAVDVDAERFWDMYEELVFSPLIGAG